MIIDDHKIDIVIERKRIKNIYFRISSDHELLVTCPRLTTNLEINSLLKKNQNAIIKMYDKYINDHKSNNKVLFLGNELVYIENPKIMFKDNIAYGPSIDKINEYLEHHALKYFQNRMDIYTKEFDNLPKFRLRIRKMKSRWGVCNKSSMTVTLNSLLIHKSYFLIDYVIVHELSHFEHMDHSASFWECVSRHYPEYKKARKELKN